MINSFFFSLPETLGCKVRSNSQKGIDKLTEDMPLHNL